MSVPSNILQQVVTWNMVDLAIFRNMSCFVSTANTIMKNPQDFKGNLGAVISYELPPRLVSRSGLVADDFQAIQQNARSLTVSEQAHVSYAGTAEQIIFNDLDTYTKRLGDSAMQSLATEVEEDVATLCETIPYRFFGNGTTPISSAQQLAQALANFRAYSSAPGSVRCYLDLQAVPAIVSTMQNQFTLKRNDENAMSWEVGNWAGVDYYQSNLLPIHLAGNVGIDEDVLTVVSTNDPTGENITQITFSGATGSGGTDADAIHQHDKMEFTSGVRFLTYKGSKPTALPLQLRVTAAAASAAGSVTVSITPALNAIAGNVNQNISTNIVAGQTVRVLPSHRAGVILSDNALYVAMPALPSTMPFPSASATDEESQVSVRLYYGVIPFKNVYGWTRDCVWGKDAVPQNMMSLIFPLASGAGFGF